MVLRSPAGPVLKNIYDLSGAIDHLKQIFKDHCNINVVPYASGNKDDLKNWVHVLDDVAPPRSLKYRAGRLGVPAELGEAGDYFAGQMAGWVGGFMPIRLAFPITIFIVEEVIGAAAIAPLLNDYIVMSATLNQAADTSIMSHEVGHRCNLLHFNEKNNLMYYANSREAPYWLHWWQRNLVRVSEHVTYLF